MTHLLATPPPIGSDAWWSEFTTSSGLASLLAVAAAIVAVVGAIITTHMGHRASQEAARRDRWWHMFTWLVENLDTLDGLRATMLVTALYRDAKTMFERAVLRAIAARLLNRGRP